MRILTVGIESKTNKDIEVCLNMRYPELICTAATEGHKGIELIETESPDLVLSTSSLRDMTLEDFAINIRSFSDVPLVVVSITESEIDRASGLEAGVDEYVTESSICSLEFLATINALFRRIKGVGFKPKGATMVNGQLVINFNTHEVFVSDEQIHLTPIEYRLLMQLARNSGKIMTHRSLLEKVWGSEYTGDINFLKKYIYRLRCKIEPAPHQPSILITERGFGYKLAKSV